MQEESGETVRGHADALVWPCPLCQQERPDREVLAQHLTDKHSVLPACLDRLLDTAAPVRASIGSEESDSQKSSDVPSSRPMPLETNGDPSDGDSNPAGPKQSTTGGRVLRSSRLKASLRTAAELEGEEEREQEAAHERHPRPEPTKSRKGAARKEAPTSTGSAPNNTSKATSDPALDKFHDPSRPHKCNACLESFSSKSALGVHYSSPSHLQRMRTGSGRQGDDSDSSSSPSAAPVGSQPTSLRPFVSSKPYQCAVCRVSYNHAFTLESHMKSVLHQTRSRNAANSAAAGSDKKGTANSATATPASAANPAGSSAGSAAQSGSTGSSAAQGSPNPLSGVTKDTEQGEAQSVTSPGTAPTPGLPLLSSPVASAQALSAFLTLLSSGSPSVASTLQPPLFAAPGTATPPQLELIAQHQLLLPLFLNGLQAQTQGSGQESVSAVLAQSVPLLAQRLSSMQNQSSGLLAGLATSLQAATVQGEKEQAADAEKLKQAEDAGEGRQNSSEETEAQVSVSAKAEAEGGREESVKGEEEEESERSEHKVATGSEGREGADRKLSSGSDVMGPSELLQDDTRKTSEATGVPEQRDGSSPPQMRTKTVSVCERGCSSADASPSESYSLKMTSDKSSLSQSSITYLERKSKLSTCICADPKCKSHVPLTPNERMPGSDISNLKGPNFKVGTPILSEFQSQVLWAFLESRSETDAASPPREDCEALGKEVGLGEEVVRKWLGEARRIRERERSNAGEARDKATDRDDEEEEGVLTIVETEEQESPTASNHAMDLSHGGGRSREREQGRESPGESCLTSDSDYDRFYTSFILTDEESQNSSVREELGSPVREEPQKGEKESSGGGGGGKVLRSSTVFCSDAEDTEEEEDGCTQKMEKRKRKREVEEVDVKRERLDPDVDLELEAQADPPPLSISADHHSFPGITASGGLHPIPLSVSLAPFPAQYLNPYVLSLPPTAIGLGIAEGDTDGDRGRAPAFSSSSAISPCSLQFRDSLKVPPLASHASPIRSLSNGGLCESALDLSIGKKHSSPAACTSSSTGEKAGVQGDSSLDGHAARPAARGVPGTGGLIVVRVKPEPAAIVPKSNSGVGGNNSNARKSTVYIRAAERVNASLTEKEQDRDPESEKQQKNPKTRRFRDMRRSRTIIQTEQLDILYGCYFKDPNPGKHEFERISEWVHLPKKVVQIWFQNMRARERKGEVRFISDGTLAAVGKPLIKFTWPLALPIFSSSPSPNAGALGAGAGIARVSSGTGPAAAPPSIKTEKEQGKEKEESKVKEPVASPSLSHLAAPRTPKLKQEAQSQASAARPAGKAASATPALPAMSGKTRSPPSSQLPQKRKRDKEVEGGGGGGEEQKTEEAEEERSTEKAGPGSTNRMVPKLSPATAVKPPPSDSHKRNGLSDWSPKSPFKINTLSREQLGLSSSRSPVATAAAACTPSSTSPAPGAKPSPADGSYPQHSTPRRPRTHLTSLQVSIMQSCYETCPHPNALECETVGTELGLPLKVVQIWFQNTRAKEKRWRLQLQKQSPNTESSKKVDTSSGSFLLYNALRANRPILPKPVQLTVLEPSAPPGVGQPAGRETLRGRCDACGVEFESRAAGRSHVFSPRHLATLRSTNFGQPPTLVNKASGSNTGPGLAAQSSSNPASTTC